MRRRRHRLRTRIVLSFLLLGFGLTALFAASTVYMQARLENQLVEEWLLKEVGDFVEFKRVNRDPDDQYGLRYLQLSVYRPDSALIPLAWRDLPSGVHELHEYDDEGRLRQFKLAVNRTEDTVGFVSYDFSQQALSQRQLMTTLGAAVLMFTGLAWLIGMWASSKVISPVTELARRVEELSGRERPEKLAPHFPKDEVGELAAVLDDYAERMTSLVKRDREFNSDVSHELRTPLAVIRGATELMLAKPDLDEKTRQRLLRIDRAALQCTDLTIALLMLSRSERGHGRTDLHKLAQQLADAGRIQLGGKPVELVVEGRDDVIVDAPEAVLSVALGNLIGNACKYTAEGEVRIEVLSDRVRIADTGPGLSREDAERLFERGYRGSYAGGTSGGGIGLSIVRRLCDLYGWEVSIAPREEQGAVAELRFV
ncbi:MAG TPA: HAMP domain-containing sensor histidine kinase [Arenimonas sp.]|nr:HAMP domain-containing sensor histidine kinase [Arenimonas sp.]